MIRPTTVIDTLGSVWHIDDDTKVYVRTPKNEGPRAPGPEGQDWGGPGAEPGLQDQVEHPFESWEIVEREHLMDWHMECNPCPHLHLVGPEVFAPHATIIYTTQEIE